MKLTQNKIINICFRHNAEWSRRWSVGYCEDNSVSENKLKKLPRESRRSRWGSRVKWQFNTPDDSLLLHSKLWKMWNYFNGRWWRCCCSYFFLLILSCSAHASAAAEDNKVVINCDYNYRVYGVFNHSIGEEGAVRLRLNQVNPNCVEHRSSLSRAGS